MLKVDSSSFGSPVSASAVSKPIFEIKENDDKKKVHILKRGKDQKRISLKKCSSLQPRRQVRSSTFQINNSR